MKIWSTMLYSAPTNSEMMQGTAYLRMSLPRGSVAKNCCLLSTKKTSSKNENAG